jgi:predicted dehydrogenase
MMGDVASVMGVTTMLAHERIEVEDTAVACLHFKSGALGVIQATTSVWPGLPKTIGVHGDQGSVVIEQDDLLRWEFKTGKPEDDAVRQRFAQKAGTSGGSSNPAAISHAGHARQLDDFAQAILNNRAPLVDGREGRKAVEVILGIYASNASRQCVNLK